jgi:hypothetical protein
MDPLNGVKKWWIITVLLVVCGCAHHRQITPESTRSIYGVPKGGDDPASSFAPLFLTYDYENPYNRIGRPSAIRDEEGRERIFVDADKPAMYYLVRRFTTDKGAYTNYIYRVHFPEVPFSVIPFHLTAGDNVGLMIVVTTDAENRPLLVTTVHTCGCYRATVPTSHLRPDALPEDWEEKPLDVYGEELPWRLDYGMMKSPRLLVHLRPAVHRVMHLEVVEEADVHDGTVFPIIETPLVPMDALKRIPLNGETTSFYHDRGLLKGHVKGSVKWWESMFLSWISFDLFVGADKVYADSKVTGNPFYTSLKPWNRDSSDMWDFARFLQFWGWRL